MYLRVLKALLPKQDTFLPTWGAHRFRYDKPDPDHVTIEDIAVSLSRQARFNGHTKFPYWVAIHSVEVSYLVPEECALEAFLHDAAESYMGDMISPLKAFFRGIWEEIEARVEKAVMIALNKKEGFTKSQEIKFLMNPWIKAADLSALKTEALVLCADDAKGWEHIENVPACGYTIRDMTCEEARVLFMNRYEELVAKRKKR